MALILPIYPNPQDDENPYTNAYAWMAGIGLDVSTASGQLTLNIHPSENTWEKQPINQITISLGEVLVPADPNADPPVEEVKFPTLEELMANEVFMSVYTALGNILYQAARNHPALKDSTQV